MKLCRIVLLVCFAGSMLFGQEVKPAFSAELAIPFGVVTGKLVPSRAHLLFIDDQQPGASFAIARQEVKDLRNDAGTLTLELTAPVTDRSGDRNRLSLRMLQPTDADAITRWYKTATASAGGAPAGARNGEELLSYESRHNHSIRGSCNGRLRISQDRVAFDSVTDIDHSRQWAMRDIKEIKRPNPYRLDIEPFVGTSYTLQLDGKGIDADDYRRLVDLVTNARTVK